VLDTGTNREAHVLPWWLRAVLAACVRPLVLFFLRSKRSNCVKQMNADARNAGNASAISYAGYTIPPCDPRTPYDWLPLYGSFHDDWCISARTARRVHSVRRTSTTRISLLTNRRSRSKQLSRR
jgi:hypothetical protein